MNKQEFKEKIAEQNRIKQAADAEIQRIRQEYIDSAPIKVGDVVKLAHMEFYPKRNPDEEVRVSAVSISYDSEVCVRYVNRKKNNGEFSSKDEVPFGGVIKDGVHFCAY